MKQYKEWNMSEYRAKCSKCAYIYEFLSDDPFTLNLMCEMQRLLQTACLPYTVSHTFSVAWIGRMLLRKFGEPELNQTLGWEWDSGFADLSVHGLNSALWIFFLQISNAC